jgi:hypothetical protein
MREQQGEEAEDDVLEGELEGRRERVDEADGGDPDGEVGDQDREDASDVPTRGAEVGEDGGGVEVGFCIQVGDRGQRNRDERAVDELVEDCFGRDDGGRMAFADDVGEDAVPEVDLETFVRPEGGDERALRPGVAAGGDFEVEEREQSSEQASRDDGEDKADFAAPGAEAVERGVGGRVPEIGEDQDEREGLEDEARKEIGAGSAETGGPRGVAGGRNAGRVGGRGNGGVGCGLRRWRSGGHASRGVFARAGGGRGFLGRAEHEERKGREAMGVSDGGSRNRGRAESRRERI